MYSLIDSLLENYTYLEGIIRQLEEGEDESKTAHIFN